MPKKSDHKPKTYVLHRSGELDLKFTGTLLAEASEQEGFDRVTGRIYRTDGGSYVAEHVIFSSLTADKEVARAARCADGAAIVEFFTVPPEPKKPKVRKLLDIGKAVLAEAGMVDSALADAHVETID